MAPRNTFRSAWEEDYPLRPLTAATLATHDGGLEPIRNYLAITGDNPESAAQATAPASTIHSAQPDLTVRSFTCPNGHSFDYLTPVNLPNTMTPTMFTASTLLPPHSSISSETVA